eukprot:COSAG01_NODE_4908_length_4635_cov_2.867725_1_plen_167_part_10
MAADDTAVASYCTLPAGTDHSTLHVHTSRTTTVLARSSKSTVYCKSIRVSSDSDSDPTACFAAPRTSTSTPGGLDDAGTTASIDGHHGRSVRHTADPTHSPPASATCAYDHLSITDLKTLLKRRGLLDRWDALTSEPPRSRRVGLCSDRAGALRRGRGSRVSTSARY